MGIKYVFNKMKWHSFLLTHQVDLSADSIQLFLHLFGHDGYLAGIKDIGHTVDLVLELWRHSITRGFSMQRSRRVELSHTVEEKQKNTLS